VAPDAHCPGILWRHDGLLNKRDVRILVLCPPRVTKATLANIRAGDVRKLAVLLGGTGGRSSGKPKDGPVWFGSGGHMRLDWPFQVNDIELDFTAAPWCQVRWMRDSLSPMSLPAGAVSSEHKEAALKHIQGLHDFADRDLQGLIIPHGIIPIHVSKLLLLFGWYAGMLKSFRFQFTKDQLAVGFNLSDLHKAQVLHHWRLVSISMISQEVHYVGASTVANCHLCNHPFRNLHEIKESRDEERALFAEVTRKHQI